MTANSQRGDSTIGAIDAGSNAIRVAIARVDPAGRPEIIDWQRVPLRLGSDAFGRGRFTPETLAAAAARFGTLRRLLEHHQVRHVRAVGTSAMRAAANGSELAACFRVSTGHDLQIISPSEEAAL
ncbi:MAG: Ppx/GppA phosphatase family protein, partial [Planctomycetota bacterium]